METAKTTYTPAQVQQATSAAWEGRNINTALRLLDALATGKAQIKDLEASASPELVLKATLKAKLEQAIVAFTRAGLDNDGDVVGLVYLVSALCGNLTQLVDEITPTSVTVPAGGITEIDHRGCGHWVPKRNRNE